MAQCDTLCVFKNTPKHYQNGGGTKKKNLDQFLTLDLDQFLTLETPNLGPIFNSTACVYIYIYIYISFSLSLSLSVASSSLSLSLLSLYISHLSMASVFSLGDSPMACPCSRCFSRTRYQETWKDDLSDYLLPRTIFEEPDWLPSCVWCSHLSWANCAQRTRSTLSHAIPQFHVE